jgi:hypothetical protein
MLIASGIKGPRSPSSGHSTNNLKIASQAKQHYFHHYLNLIFVPKFISNQHDSPQFCSSFCIHRCAGYCNSSECGAETYFPTLNSRIKLGSSATTCRHVSNLKIWLGELKLNCWTRTVERYQLLPKDEDFVYDFNKGESFFANRKSFPALTGYGTSFSLSSIPGNNYFTFHP